jgi:enolase
MFIKSGGARTIKNSRGEKTIEIYIKTFNGTFYASAPSGKSKGKHEVQDYNDRGINWSVKLADIFIWKFVNKNLMIKDLDDLVKIEKHIKDFENIHGKMGGNTTYAIESALIKAAAKENKKELWKFIFDSMNFKEVKMPMPVGNCIGGGLHTKGINGKKPDFQEFLLIPDEQTFSRAVTKNIHAYFYAKKILKREHRAWIMKTNDEHAWNTNLTNEQVLDVLSIIAEKYDLRIGLDVASSSFVDKNGYYDYNNKELMRDRTEQIDYMKILAERYKLFYIEDPFMEEDFSGFKGLLSKVNSCPASKHNSGVLPCGRKTLIVGDDLTTTNIQRTERAVRSGSINAMIVKPNQIGSLVEVKRVIEFCKKNKIKIIFSHRSGETMDDALGDFAVGFQADFVKCGIFGRERLIKLRRIMEIEKSLRKI